MSSLGFGGAAGVGRPFTIQDLFSAVSQAGQSQSQSTSTASTINQFLDEEGESITIVDTFVLAASASGAYDTELWMAGVWS